MKVTKTKNHPFFDDEKLLLLISLARITFLNCAQKNILVKNLDSADTLALLSIEDIEKLTGRVHSKRIVWNGKENLRLAKAALQRCKLLEIRILYYGDEDYPEILRQIFDPPFLLYCRGDVSLLVQPAVSIVGTRRLTPMGKSGAMSFAYDAVLDGRNVISGLAAGIDGAAHQGALNAFFDEAEKKSGRVVAKTVAVLPGSIDNIVPRTHVKLASQILKTGGLLLSEYEPGMEIANWHFVARNRIIAGLSCATVVVEAPAGSGALITADFALEYGRDVMFHSACFGELAKQIAGKIKDQLTEQHARGEVSKYKIENTPEKFLEAGAPVIDNYKDFCKALAEAPGKRVSVPVQQNLF